MHHPVQPNRRLFQAAGPILLILLTGLVIFLRDPHFLTSPRLWAEEGSLHFAYSYSHPWWQALFWPQVGYLNFWPNLATILALLPPLESAPLVTTLMAFLVQLVPCALILWSQSPLWEGWWRKLLGVAVVLYVPLSVEGWLNTINSYTFFAAASFLILVDDAPATNIRRWVYRLLLLVGGLSGTLSCFLLPLFLFRAFMEKDKERGIQSALLTACAVFQAALIFSYRDTLSITDRFSFLGIATLGHVTWMQTILLFSLGYEQALELSRSLFTLAVIDVAQFRLIGRLLLVGAGILFLILSHNLSWRKKALFLGAYAILLFLAVQFSVISDKYTFIVTGMHQRAFLAPNMIFGWMLLHGIRFPPGKGWRVNAARTASLLCTLLLASAVFWGVINYRADWTRMSFWPDWKQEVYAWRANPEYLLRIQPQDWVVRLQGQPVGPAK